MGSAIETERGQPAAAKAYLALERLIVTLALAPGKVTTEGALIERLGLGRTPVREAIQRLAWEGLIDIRPRAGLAIAPLHPGDWLRVMEAREGLEAVLARSAARRIDGRSAPRFEEAALAMRAASATGNVVAFLEADKAVDVAMSDAADNSFAARVASPLQTHSRRFWFRYNRATDLAVSADRHLAVIAAIMERNEKAAETATRTLMALLRDRAEAAARL